MKKLLMAILAGACALTCALGLAACNKDDTPDNGATTGDHTHQWESSWMSDENKHWHKCKYCDEAILTTSHEWEVTHADVEPTCYSEGSGTFTCRRCDRTKEDVIPATGKHDFSGTLLSSSAGHFYKCQFVGCEETSTPVQHVEPSAPKITEPTDMTSTGKAEYACTECGYLIRTVTLPNKSTIYTFTLNVTKLSADSSAMTPVMTQDPNGQNSYALQVSADYDTPLYTYSFTGYDAYGNVIGTPIDNNAVSIYLCNEQTLEEEPLDATKISYITIITGKNGDGTPYAYFRIRREGTFTLKFQYANSAGTRCSIIVRVTAS